MNKNVNKKSKGSFIKKLIQEEKRGLKFIGCALICLALFFTGMRFGSNSAACYTDRQQAIERVKQTKSEFGTEYDDILSDILSKVDKQDNITNLNYYYNSTYDVESCQVTYELGIISEMIINNANKDLILEQCDLLISQMCEDSDNLINAYKLKQLVIEKY